MENVPKTARLGLLECIVLTAPQHNLAARFAVEVTNHDPGQVNRLARVGVDSAAFNQARASQDDHQFPGRFLVARGSVTRQIAGSVFGNDHPADPRGVSTLSDIQLKARVGTEAANLNRPSASVTASYPTVPPIVTPAIGSPLTS